MVNNRISGQLVFELGLLIFGLVYFFQTITMKTTAGAKFFPLVFSSIFIFAILLVLKNTIVKNLKAEREQSSSAKPFSLKKFLCVFLSGVLLALFTYLFSYWLAILIILPVMMYLLDGNKWSMALLILPAGMVLAIYLLFVKFLSIRLPAI